MRSGVGSRAYKQLTHLFNWQVVFPSSPVKKQSAICCSMNVFIRSNDNFLKWRCQHVHVTFMESKKIKYLNVRLKRLCYSHMWPLFDQLSTVFKLKVSHKRKKTVYFLVDRSHFFARCSILRTFPFKESRTTNDELLFLNSILKQTDMESWFLCSTYPS